MQTVEIFNVHDVFRKLATNKAKFEKSRKSIGTFNGTEFQQKKHVK